MQHVGGNDSRDLLERVMAVLIYLAIQFLPLCVKANLKNALTSTTNESMVDG
jgi:hypothetical protein